MDEKDAGIAGKGAAPATNFRARGHCGAGAWLRRRSKRKIDAVHGDEKQRARRDGGLAGKKKGRLRGPERGRKMCRAKRVILRRSTADRATLSRENHPLSFFLSHSFSIPRRYHSLYPSYVLSPLAIDISVSLLPLIPSVPLSSR